MTKTKNNKIPKIRTTANYQHTIFDVEISKGKSMTIPGEHYTIQELIKKHVRGNFPDGLHRKPIWAEDQTHDSMDLEYINRLDFASKREIIDENQLRIDDHNNFLKEEEQKQSTLKKASQNEPLKKEGTTAKKGEQSEQKTEVD